MARRRKSEGKSLRDKLSQDLLAAVQNDFASNGVAAIEKLRQVSPAKYGELVSKLVAGTADPADPLSFKDCQSMTDIGRKLLLSVGYESPSDEAVTAAVEANDRFVAELEAIAANEKALQK